MNDQQIQPLIKIINQLFDLEKKLLPKQDLINTARHFERIRENLLEMDILIHNPIKESFSETRTDCEASIAGELSNQMVITEVIKPIIYKTDDNQHKVIIQRGVVIVQSK